MTSPLNFGTITICDPSTGNDRYTLARQSFGGIDYVAYNVPNTSGSLFRAIGVAQQEKPEYEFEGYIIRSSASALLTVISNIQDAMRDTKLRSLTYSLSGGALQTVTNCTMVIDVSDYTKDTNGRWYVRFHATFIKVA